MRRTLICLAVASIFLEVHPAAAQLASSAWPKQFGNNANQGRTTTSGPTSNFAVADTEGVSNCSAPTIGPDGTIYVTSSSSDDFGSSALLAYSASGNVLTLLWQVDLTSHALKLSAPTIAVADNNSQDGYAWIGGGSQHQIPEGRLVRVNLSTQTASSIAVGPTGKPNDASGCPPVIDSDGVVYVSTHTGGFSGGGMRITATNPNLTQKWTWHAGTGKQEDDPGTFHGLVLKDGGVNGTHYVFAHGDWQDIHPPNETYHFFHKVTCLSTNSSATSATEVYDDDVDLTDNCGSTTEGYIGHPVLSDDETEFYISHYEDGLPVTYYLEARSASSGSYVRDITLGNSWFWAAPAAVRTNGNVVTLGSSITELTSSFGSVRTLGSGTATPPSIDANDNVYFVGSDGSVKVWRSASSTVHSVAASAYGEIAIRSSTTLVVRDGSGISLITGS